MVRKIGSLFVVALIVAFGLGGCGGDSVVPTENEQNNSSGVVTGDINPTGGNFEITTETSGNSEDPVPGPFIIRGTNVHYVDSLAVLSVDFSVEHRCRCEFLEPIGLTFINLLPPGVTVENPDNGETGPGAAIVFDFENDDGVWTPFEESLPRTVHFGVDNGVSIGFVGRIDFGMSETGGSIGGMVWHDANRDGILDTDESGIGGVVIHMYRTDGPEFSPPEILWRTITDRSGSYRFDDLDAGIYKVERPPRGDLRPTTPPVMNVILVEENGQVQDFLMANFGCVPSEPPPPLISLGDYVHTSGKISRSKDDDVLYRFDASEILVLPCGIDAPPEIGSNLDGDVIRPCTGTFGNFCGPVTAIDSEKRVLEIMGTPVFFDVKFDTIPDDSTYYADLRDNNQPDNCDCIDFDKVELGDRVCIEVLRVPPFAADPLLVGLRILKWSGDDEKINGPVEMIQEGRDEKLAFIKVLGTKIWISESTVIKPMR